MKGDFVRFEDGNAQFIEVPIVKVETNRFLLGALLDPAPQAGDSFYILRYATQRVDDTGSQIVSVTQGPIQYKLNGTNTEVARDTSIPANSKALPVNVLNSAGTLTDFATSANQTNGNQLTQITDGAGASVTIHNISSAMNGGDKALVTMAAIHGKNGGSYLDLLCDATGILSTNVQNFPATQAVTGTVAATQSGAWGVGLNAGTNLVGKVGIDQTTNGTTNAVYVNNFPATQPVSGSVSVSNFPATQAVTGTFWQATQPISAASLPLPSGAATETTLADVKTSVELIDNAVGSSTGGTAGANSLLAGGVYNSAAPTLTNGQQ